MVKLTDKEISDACNTSVSMSEAALALGINYKTLRTYAKRLGCFDTNQAGKGVTKNFSKCSLEEIFNGKPYQSHKLKLRLLNEGVKKHECESCKITEWLDQPTPIELHHVDGDHLNNKLDNLQLLCPNCHALTDTYRGKNIK